MALSTPGELPPVHAGAAMSRTPDRRTLPSRISSKMAPSAAAPNKTKAAGMQPQPQLQQQLSYHTMTTAIFHDNSRNIEELFISAARDGDCERLQNFLAHRDDMLLSVDVRDKRSGNTPLIWAAKRGHGKTVTLLLSHGADPTLRNYDGQTALEVASPAIKQALLDSLERDGSAQQRLLQAAWQGNAEVVRALLGGNRAVSVDFRNSDGFTALLLVARDVFLFEKLGPQLVAAYNPRAVVMELLHHRADVNICDFEGKTPLHHVAACKSSLAASLVSCLVSASNLERPDKRCFAPIHCACQSGNADVLSALLAAGSSVNCRGFGGATPLHVSAYNNHDQVAFMLLAYGADASLVDDGSQAPADVAHGSRIKKALKDARSTAAQRGSLRLAPVKVHGLRGSSGGGNGTPGLTNDGDMQQQQQQQQQQSRGSDGETAVRLSVGSARLEDSCSSAAVLASPLDAGNYVPELGGYDTSRKLGATRSQQQQPPVLPQQRLGAIIRSPGGRDALPAPGNSRSAAPTVTAQSCSDAQAARCFGSGPSASGLPLERRAGSISREDSTLSIASECGIVTAPYSLPRSSLVSLAAQQKPRYLPATSLYPFASVHDVAAACDTIIVKGRSPSTLARTADMDTKPDRAKSLTPLSSTADWGKLSSLSVLPENDDDALSSPELTSASPCFTRAAAGAAAEGRAGTKLTFYSIEEEPNVTPRMSNRSPSLASGLLLLDSSLATSHFSIEQSRTAEHRGCTVSEVEAAHQTDGGRVGLRSLPISSDGKADHNGRGIRAPNGPAVVTRLLGSGVTAPAQGEPLVTSQLSTPAMATIVTSVASGGSDSSTVCTAPELRPATQLLSAVTTSTANVRGSVRAAAARSDAEQGQLKKNSTLQKNSVGSHVPASDTFSSATAYTCGLAVRRDTTEPPTEQASGAAADPKASVEGHAAPIADLSNGPFAHYGGRTEPRDYVVAACKKLYQPISSLILTRLPGGGELPYADTDAPPVAHVNFPGGAPVHSLTNKVARGHQPSSPISEVAHEPRKLSSSNTSHRRSRSGSSESGRSRSECASNEGLCKDAAVTISFGQHNGPVIEDVFEGYPRNVYEPPPSAIVSSKPASGATAEAGCRKKGKAKASKGSKKKGACKVQYGVGATTDVSGEHAQGSAGKQRSLKQRGAAAVGDAAAPGQTSRRARSGRRRGQKKAGDRSDGDARTAVSPVNQALASPSSTALISGVGWQLATKMNIIEVDREHLHSQVAGGTGDVGATGSLHSYSFHEMSPLQKREELKRLLLAMRDSTSRAPGAADTTSLIPETMLAIHEFAKTVPDLEEQHEWDALFGLRSKDALLATPVAPKEKGEDGHQLGKSHEEAADGRPDGLLDGATASDSVAVRQGESMAAEEDGIQAAALRGLQEKSDLVQAPGKDTRDTAEELPPVVLSARSSELFEPSMVAYRPPNVFSGPEESLSGDGGGLAWERLNAAGIAGVTDPTAVGRFSIDMATAIDDILASPPLTPRRRLSKTLLAEIHNSWEEIASNGGGSGGNMSQSDSPGSSGRKTEFVAAPHDCCHPPELAVNEGSLEQWECAEGSSGSFSWDDTATAIDRLLLQPDDDGCPAAETAGDIGPLLPRCPLEIVPSKSKPPAAGGPRTSAHSPKMATTHPAPRVSTRPAVRHRPSAGLAGASSSDPQARDVDDDRLNSDMSVGESNLPTPDLSIHIAQGNAGVALMHSMAEEILSRPSSRTYTSRLGSRRSARSPVGVRSQSASTEDSQVKSMASAAESGGEILRWKKGNVLGKGAFATVYCGLTSAGQLIAVKQIELNTDDWDKAESEYENIQEEVDLLKTLRHRNIVGFLGTSLEDHVVNIFMQFIPGGTLSSLLSRFGAFEEQVFCRYTRQIVDGINYLHTNNVIHRDIKGANIMLMSNGVIKLIDFGCAKRLCVNLSLSASLLQRSMKGTPYWMAPEVVKETGHGKKSDIWSIGCTVFEMATTRPPWAEMQPMAAIFAIGSDKPVPQLPETFSSPAREFVSACMTRDPALRLDATELLAHPFIAHTSVK